MRREGDISGPEGRRIKLEAIREALQHRAKSYSGEVLLVPKPQDLADAIGRTTGYLYSGSEGKPGERYVASLEEATGLTVIHKGGLVLAGEMSEEAQEDISATKIRELAGQLSEEKRAKLIGQLASTLVSRQ
jgi:hypothetical protein